MLETDKKKFAGMANQAARILNGKEMNQEDLVLWWNLLVDYDLNDIEVAFHKALDDCEGRLVPAKVKKYLPSKFNHPGSEEAFTHLVGVVGSSGYLSDEMREAWGACSDHLDRNDRVAGRMAFKEKYEALIKLATSNPKWSWYATDRMDYDQVVELKKDRLVQLREKGWMTEKESSERLSLICEQSGTSLLPHQKVNREGLQKVRAMIATTLNAT